MVHGSKFLKESSVFVSVLQILEIGSLDTSRHLNVS